MAARRLPANVQMTRFLIEPRAPFRLDLTAWALRRRAHNAIDRWTGSSYERVLRFDGDGPYALSVTQEEGLLAVSLGRRQAGESAERLAGTALERILGLHADLAPFAAMAEEDPWLGPLAQRMRGLKPPRFPSVFEALVNGIACQQLSLVVGIHLLNRLTAAHGRPVSADADGPRAFPDPDQLASLQPKSLMSHGFSLSKARTIVDAARAIVAGELELEALERLDDRTVMERLTGLRGVGRWTAEYVMLRGLGRLEIFPGDDVGAHNSLSRHFDMGTPMDYESVQRLVARWQPYAGMVYFHLLLDSLSRSGFVSAP